tara:strand:+ start:479 stop:634 length:156 start_codon:yes stop_codon:yes gene_type:complete
MPYEIKKLPHSTKYQVKLKNTGRILAYETSLAKAKAQIRAIEYNKYHKGVK